MMKPGCTTLEPARAEITITLEFAGNIFHMQGGPGTGTLSRDPLWQCITSVTPERQIEILVYRMVALFEILNLLPDLCAHFGT